MLPNIAIAEQTSSYYFNAAYPAVKYVEADGGVISTTINTDTGAISNALTPAFEIGTNAPVQQTLTMSVNSLTSSGNVNSLFTSGSNRYIVFTNNTVVPSSTSVSNITGGSPAAASNPNAIAYLVNAPSTSSGLSVAYSSTNRNWQFTTTSWGRFSTTLNIPISTPLSNTFSTNDEPGNYRATVTLSFN